MTPLAEVNDFLNALDDVLNVGGLVCAEEPSYDVISDIASPADIANINWREDAIPIFSLLVTRMVRRGEESLRHLYHREREPATE